VTGGARARIHIGLSYCLLHFEKLFSSENCLVAITYGQWFRNLTGATLDFSKLNAAIVLTQGILSVSESIIQERNGHNVPVPACMSGAGHNVPVPACMPAASHMTAKLQMAATIW
jgi:hypothetical protein